mmetsp:Transcript_18625/g.63456  ORF Transcript_18625/g.63456 Transcript_18625/m.63456 type:complete len:210 (-) Transcript_18625:378-1007(-)
MGLSFDQSGKGPVEFSLQEVQQLAVDCGFSKENVDPSKPLAVRVNLGKFFDCYGVKALSLFKKKFFTEELLPPSQQKAADEAKAKAKAAEEAADTVDLSNITPKPVSEYDALSKSYLELKWKMISRPGGATMKPTDWYRLHGCVEQVEKGDCTTEKPMWAETGGLDFHGRECWEYYNQLKGMSTQEAKEKFCRVYAEAEANNKANFRVF